MASASKLSVEKIKAHLQCFCFGRLAGNFLAGCTSCIDLYLDI